MSPETPDFVDIDTKGVDEIRRRVINMALRHTLGEACQNCNAAMYATNQLSHNAIKNGLGVRQALSLFLKEAKPNACGGPSASKNVADPCRQEPITECGHSLGGDVLSLLWRE